MEYTISESGSLIPSFAIRHGPGDEPPEILPTRPIWPGFLINTLFYAAIWLGVFFGFASAKRFIRVKRGRCPRCGYDLRGQKDAMNRQQSATGSLRCPECGWNRQEQSV